MIGLQLRVLPGLEVPYETNTPPSVSCGTSNLGSKEERWALPGS